MVLLFSILGLSLYNRKVDEILSKTETRLLNGAAAADSLLSSNLNKIFYINNNYYIKQFLESDNDDNLVGIMTFNDYLQSVIMAIKSDNTLLEVVIYDLSVHYDGDFIRSVENFTKTSGDSVSLSEVFQSGPNEVVMKVSSIIGDGSPESREYLRMLKKVETLRKSIAITEIRLPFSQIKKCFDFDLPKGSFIFLELKNGGERHPIALGDVLSALESQDESSFFSFSADLKSGLGRVLMLIPRALVNHELNVYISSLAAAFAAIMAIFFGAVEVVAWLLTKRLNALFVKIDTKSIDQISEEAPDLGSADEDDEFATMEKRFRELALRIKEHYKEKSEYELERKLLETKLLQERINPHFLYNTLSTMKWVSDDKRVQSAIDSMVKYYRIALNKGSSVITIEQEMEMIGEYLKLQKFAYGNDFDFFLEIEDGLGKHFILKHLLQPLVENAVLHGLSGRESGGSITVKAFRKDGDVVFEVHDNGAGIEEEKIAKLLEPSNGNGNGKGGYGMANIQKRLEVFYGKSCGITAQSRKGQGTLVSLSISEALAKDVPAGMR
jgi:sensor histidine kinase YesM